MMNAFEHVPELPSQFKWIRNHSQRQYEIWDYIELRNNPKDGEPLAIISDESIAKTKKGIREALEDFASSLH